MCSYVFLHSSEGEVLRLMLWEKRTGMVNIHMTSCQHLLTMDDAPFLKGSSPSSISKFYPQIWNYGRKIWRRVICADNAASLTHTFNEGECILLNKEMIQFYTLSAIKPYLSFRSWFFFLAYLVVAVIDFWLLGGPNLKF